MTSFFVRRFSSFTYLNVTQFLGALNDNIYKLLLVFFFIQLEGIENSHRILSITGAIFVLPFLLFSNSSGTLADRFSKRNIIIFTKICELVFIIGGVFSFYFESIYGSYAVLFLLAAQSALFAPSKYGILPELVATDKITQANGLMTSFTFLAIILGTFCPSFLLDITGKNFISAALFCTSLSVIGLITSFCIEYTPPSGATKKLNLFFLKDAYEILKYSYRIPSLLAAIFGSAFFLLLGAFVQLNMIPYAVQSLHLTDVKGGYLFLLTAIGIGLGSLWAGRISGKTVELGLVPLAAIGITICFYLLDIMSDNILIVLAIIFIQGILGGLYQIPLDSYIQVSSPNDYRGRIVATTNFLSYFGVFVASVLLYLITEVFGFGASKGFAVMGAITLVVAIFNMFQFFDYLSRYVAMILSKLHFRTTLTGIDNIPSCPAIYVCSHTAWNDTLLILGAQRRRMRFFIEREQDHSKWFKMLYKLLRIVNIPSIEPLEKNQQCLAEIKNLLSKGFSICIFVENPHVAEEMEKISSSYSFKEITQELNTPIIPVSIEKGSKEKEARVFKRLLNRIHVPATLSFGAQCLW